MNSKHEALNQYAKQLLITMGFQSSEIQEEYVLRPTHREYSKGYNSNFKREIDANQSVRIDVVGISNSKRIAIECGITNSENLAMEKLFFDEVIVLPFFKMDTERLLLDRRIEALQDELKEWKLKYEEYRNKRETEWILNLKAVIKYLISVLETIGVKDDGQNTVQFPYRFTYELNQAYSALLSILQEIEKDANHKD